MNKDKNNNSNKNNNSSNIWFLDGRRQKKIKPIDQRSNDNCFSVPASTRASQVMKTGNDFAADCDGNKDDLVVFNCDH